MSIVLLILTIIVLMYYFKTHPAALAALKTAGSPSASPSGSTTASPAAQTSTANSQTKAAGMTFIGCYNDHPRRMMSGGFGNARTTPSICADVAKRSGMRYMGLQDPDTNGNVSCFWSNDLTHAQSMGVGTCSGGGRLGGGWVNAIYDLGANSSNTASGTGTGTGMGTKVGCFGDSDSRAMNLTSFGVTKVSVARCAAAVRASGQRYMGLQDPDASGSIGCWSSNNWPRTIIYGPRTPCPDSGGRHVNTVYDLNS
jgi:hypothetical protein